LLISIGQIFDEELDELYKELEDRETGGLTLDHLFVLVS